jgi:hypothetical protein
MQLSQHDFSKEGKIDRLEWQKMEWKDYDDFLRKYDSSVNLESFAIRDVTATQYGLLGILVERGIINRDLMYDWTGENAIMDWTKYREIALAQRKEFNRPQIAANWEYLYGEMVKVAKARGVEVEKFATKF